MAYFAGALTRPCLHDHWIYYTNSLQMFRSSDGHRLYAYSSQ